MTAGDLRFISAPCEGAETAAAALSTRHAFATRASRSSQGGTSAGRDDLDVVPLEHGISGQNGERFDLRLRDEQAKEAANREKDRVVLPALRRLLERSGEQRNDAPKT